MNKNSQNHLPLGHLLALAETGKKPGKNSIEAHIESCIGCADWYKFLFKHFNKTTEPEVRITDKQNYRCPKTDMDMLEFFLIFLKTGLPEEQLTKVLRHVNNCYRCFEDFIINWTAYVQGGQKNNPRRAKMDEEGILQDTR